MNKLKEKFKLQIKQNPKLIYILLISLFFNLFSITFIAQNYSKIKNAVSFEIAEQKYPLLSSRIIQDNPQDILINFFNLRTHLQSVTSPYGDNFAMYFEYLPTGTSIGVNSNNEFFAASLFKVPVIMAYYHKLERTDEDKNQVVTISKSEIDNRFGSLYKAGAGSKIKISDAIKLSLVNSDNTAAEVIADRVDDDDFNAVYNSLDINLQTQSGGALVTARNYSSILKALYFSAVINRDDSQEILNYLTQTSFNNEIVAGVPKGVKVAHKIGDYKDAKGREAFMDCGIVYVPRRPYALCMLSIGSRNTASDRMKNISQIIYDYVSSAQTPK